MNHILVTVDSTSSNQIEGSQLFFDSEFNPEGFNQTKGKVVALPIEWTRFSPWLEIGDIVHFHYNALDAGDGQLVEIDGDHVMVFPISLDMCLWKETERGPVAASGRTIVEEVYDEETEEVTMPDGKVIKISKCAVGNFGIISDTTEVTHSPWRAKVISKGQPLRPYQGFEPDICLDYEEGDIIYFEKHCDFDNAGHGCGTKGKAFYIEQDLIIAVERW